MRKISNFVDWIIRKCICQLQTQFIRDMRKILSFIICLLFAITLYAAPANRKPMLVKQSDGTILSIVMQGDEALHFYTTLDGKYVVKGENGDFFYATYSIEDGFVSTGTLAHDAANRTETEKELLSAIDYEAIKNDVVKTHSERSAQYVNSFATRATSNIVTTGEVLVPVLLVEFQDTKFSFKKDDLDRKFNEKGYDYAFTPGGIKSYGSIRDYFIAQSDSMFIPKFVLTDIVTLPKKMADYGGNNSYGNDKNPYGMIVDGITVADASMDFSKFDNDGDGKVDYVLCIYAGYSEANNASANAVWPHKSSLVLKGVPKIADGVSFDIYACAAELNLNESYEKDFGKWMDGVGAICHEFSHCLGLVDVYDVSKTSGNWCMQDWDLMDYGNFAANGYLPVGYNSFQKESCGWKKMEVLDKKGKYSMKPQSQGGVGYKIVNDANSNEFFVLENRKREGWDQWLAADGMMIIHVDYNSTAWSNNKVNTTSGRPRFQIVPADNDLTVYTDANSEKFYASLANDLWPGKNDNNKFFNTSLPAAKVFTGGYLNKPVTNIKYENYVASFNFMGGEVATPVVMPATEVTDNSFVANWSAVEYATKYLLELYRLEAAESNDGEVVVLVDEDFLKCNSSNTAIQDDMDTYMQISGWNGSNVYSENGVLCIGSLNNSGMLATPKFNVAGDVVVTLKANKYNSNATSIKLLVEIIDASGVVISSKEISAAGTFDLSATVDGEFFVRFSTDAEFTNKRVLVDDISVIATLPYKKTLVGEYESVNNALKFNDLEQGEYLYRVKAFEGDDVSQFSEYEKVVLSVTSVSELDASDGEVTVYTITGVKVFSGSIDALRNLPRGIYVVKSNTGIKKVKID